MQAKRDRTYSRNSDNGMGNFLAKVGLSGLLHFDQDHSRNFLSSKHFRAFGSLEFNVGLGVLFHNLEGEILDVMLDSLVAPFAADQPLSIENGVFGVGSELILGGISNQSFSLGGKCNVGRRDSVTLVVSNNFNTSIFKHTNTVKEKRSVDILIDVELLSDLPRVCRSQINADYSPDVVLFRLLFSPCEDRQR